MPSVLITGANRGIGEAFIKYYAAQPDHQVFGIVRNKKSADENLAKNGIKNVTLLQADITDAKAMQAAADEVSKATGGSLDILIPNAAVAAVKNRYKPLPDFPSMEDIEADLNEAFSVNVVGAAFTIAAFLPLIRKGQTKKIAAISTAMALDDLTNNFEIPIAAAYSVSKAGMNSLIAKYSVALKKENILVFDISPGYVGTDMNDVNGLDEEGIKAVQEMGTAFFKFKPDWDGQAITPEQSVSMMANVIKQATVEKDGGQYGLATRQ